jgi:hypothetical protein
MIAIPSAAHWQTNEWPEPAAKKKSTVRRRVCPQAGRALEILGHAIEYLTDEYVRQAGTISAGDSELEAVQLLMKINRQIYFACPVVPTILDRWRSLVRLKVA